MLRVCFLLVAILGVTAIAKKPKDLLTSQRPADCSKGDCEKTPPADCSKGDCEKGPPADCSKGDCEKGTSTVAITGKGHVQSGSSDVVDSSNGGPEKGFMRRESRILIHSQAEFDEDRKIKQTCEYALSKSGHLHLGARHKHFGAALLADNTTSSDKEHIWPFTSDPVSEFPEEVCEATWMNETQKQMCTEIRPSYVELEQVLWDNGLNFLTGDGSLFDDGQGMTTGLYNQFVKPGTTVCETGFGGGYGALYSLSICADCMVYIFDDAGHPYAHAAAEHLQEKFPNRLTVTWGDSKSTLPTFMTEHSDVKCDFVMIDGERNYEGAKADTLNFAKMVSSPTTPVLQHDCPIPGMPDSMNGVCRAWHELAEENVGCVKGVTDLVAVSYGQVDADKCDAASLTQTLAKRLVQKSTKRLDETKDKEGDAGLDETLNEKCTA